MTKKKKNADPKTVPFVKISKNPALINKVTNLTWTINSIEATQGSFFLPGHKFKFYRTTKLKRIGCQHGVPRLNGTMKWNTLYIPNSGFTPTWFAYGEVGAWDKGLITLTFKFGIKTDRHEMTMVFDFSKNAPTFQYYSDDNGHLTSHGRGGGGN